MTAPKTKRDARREADAPTADELDGYCADDVTTIDRIRRGVAGAADWGAL